eukprot:g5271.t1
MKKLKRKSNSSRPQEVCKRRRIDTTRDSQTYSKRPNATKEAHKSLSNAIKKQVKHKNRTLDEIAAYLLLEKMGGVMLLSKFLKHEEMDSSAVQEAGKRLIDWYRNNDGDVQFIPNDYRTKKSVKKRSMRKVKSMDKVPVKVGKPPSSSSSSSSSSRSLPSQKQMYAIARSKQSHSQKNAKKVTRKDTSNPSNPSNPSVSFPSREPTLSTATFLSILNNKVTDQRDATPWYIKDDNPRTEQSYRDSRSTSSKDKRAVSVSRSVAMSQSQRNKSRSVSPTVQPPSPPTVPPPPPPSVQPPSPPTVPPPPLPSVPPPPPPTVPFPPPPTVPFPHPPTALPPVDPRRRRKKKAPLLPVVNASANITSTSKISSTPTAAAVQGKQTSTTKPMLMKIPHLSKSGAVHTLVLDLDHTIIHMLRLEKWPKPAHRLCEHVVILKSTENVPYKIGVRKGVGQLLLACLNANIKVCISTCNKLGKEIVDAISKTLKDITARKQEGDAWAKLPVTVVDDKSVGAKSLEDAGVHLSSPASHTTLLGSVVGGKPKTVVIFDDNDVAWKKSEREFVWKVSKFDLLKPLNTRADVHREILYISNLLQRLAQLHNP